MSEVPQQTQQLVLLLREQTEGGRRLWEAGSAETEFVSVHEAGSLIILSVDGDGTAPFELRIVDPDGALVGKHTSEDAGGDGLGDLYGAAQQSATKPSRVVEALLAEIGKGAAAEVEALMGSTVKKVKEAPEMDEKVALVKPLLRKRIQGLRAEMRLELEWPELIEPFPSGGGVRNALTQAFREMRASNEINCSVDPEPDEGQGFGGGKRIRFLD